MKSIFGKILLKDKTSKIQDNLDCSKKVLKILSYNCKELFFKTILYNNFKFKNMKKIIYLSLSILIIWISYIFFLEYKSDNSIVATNQKLEITKWIEIKTEWYSDNYSDLWFNLSFNFEWYHLEIDYSDFIKDKDDNLRYIFDKISDKEKIWEAIWKNTLSHYSEENQSDFKKYFDLEKQESRKSTFDKDSNFIRIKNINWDDFSFLYELDKKLDFQYYDFEFINFDKNYYKLFNFVKDKNYITELDIKFLWEYNNNDLKYFFGEVKKFFKPRKIYSEEFKYHVQGFIFIGNNNFFR